MSRPHDQVIDDDEAESCPLCIEELDLSDRNFYPCPCGYQICQFCYNNIKTTMNGLCPACRRRYDDADIVFKKPTEEQLASHKESLAQQQKRKAAARQKEAAKREADTLNRKHLSGIRVRQKNLVYITGMKPSTTAENLSEVLRRDEYFGQYGKIVKVVVSKAKDSTNPNAPVGVYVTFETQEAAARCIACVDGAQNYDTRLRAQYGTTKYCSAYLRGEACTNKGCMFLHEPGDENESFSRQDLSSMNVASTQTSSQAPTGTVSPTPQSQPPPQVPQSFTAASRGLEDRRGSRDDGRPPSVTSEGPALPSSASWGSKRAPSRQASQHQNINASSPLATSTTPADQSTQSIPEEPNRDPVLEVSPKQPPLAKQSSSPLRARKPKRPPSLLTLYRNHIANRDFNFEFDENALDVEEQQTYQSMPSWIDPSGGAKRKLGRKDLVEHNLRENDNHVATQALSAIAATDPDEGAVAGSLQLGGEPDDQNLESRQRGNAIQPPSLDNISSPIFGMEQTLSPTAGPNSQSHNDRQRQLLLQQFKSGSPISQGGQGPNHGRQASRFSFANDTSATASVNPVASQKLMTQQKSMMPPSHYQQPPSSTSQYFPSGVQGPPPGLRTTGTPPVSGGGMFGQGHGFATAGLRYGMSAGGGRGNDDEMMRDLIRNRGGSAGSGHASSDAGRREYMFPSLSQSSTPASHLGLPSFPYGPPSGAFHDHGPPKQKKKGKKHRHANTSSSGGGVVDLADPSILQARMHQTSGHGHYGAQGQSQGVAIESLHHRSNSTSAKVTEWPSAQPLGDVTPGPHESRLSTPAAPPGLTVPPDQSSTFEHDLPIMPELGKPPTKQSAAQTPVSNVFKPISPNFPQGLPDKPSATILTRTTNDAAFPTLPKARPTPFTSTISQLTKAPNAVARDGTHAKVGKAEQTATESNTNVEGQRKPTDGINEKRAIESGIGKGSQTNQSSATQPTAEVSKDEDEDEKQTTFLNKRQHPGTLDIYAATKASESIEPPFAEATHGINPASSPARSAVEQSFTTASLSSRSATPGPSEGLSRRSTQPRTLRVLPTSTPKTETPPPISTTSSTAPTVPTAPRTGGRSQMHSRQASSTSVAILDTPASERTIQDSGSVTTESQSRASSPPLTANRIGSAPTREKTKSQAKKERKDRAKDEKPQTEPETPSQPEVVQEPIVGRKTKAKKPKVAQPPKPLRTVSAEKASEPETVEGNSEEADAETPTVEMKREEPKPAEEVKEEVKPDEEEKKEPSIVNSIVEGLQSSGEVSQQTINKLLNSVGFSAKASTGADLKNPAPLTALTQQEISQLKSGKPVRRRADGYAYKANEETPVADRLLVTPNLRLCLRGLPRKLEDRLLELDERVAKSKPPKKYSHRATNTAAATAAKLVDELMREMTNAMMQAEDEVQDSMPTETMEAAEAQATAQPDDSHPPAYGDDALAYRNQFILPLSPAKGGNGVIPTMNVGGQTYASESAAGRSSADTDPVSSTYSPEAIDVALPATGSAYSRSANDLSYNASANELSSGSAQTSTSRFSQTTAATSSQAPSKSSASTTFPNLNLKPLTDLAASLPPLTNYTSQLDSLAGQAARDALAASLGAASSTLASVASDAAAAAQAHGATYRNASASSSNRTASSAAWQTRGWENLHLEPELKELKDLNMKLDSLGSMDPGRLPQEVMNMGAEAIRQAVLSAAPGLQASVDGLSSSSQASASSSNRAQAQAGQAAGQSNGREKKKATHPGNKRVTDDAAKIMSELEAALVAGRKELESVEKRLSGLAKKNRRVVGV